MQAGQWTVDSGHTHKTLKVAPSLNTSLPGLNLYNIPLNFIEIKNPFGYIGTKSRFDPFHLPGRKTWKLNH